jgi:hypothetical protein
MKTLIIIISVVMTFTLTSLKPSDNSDYGAWKSTSCFSGLDFCVKKGEYNEYAKKYHWDIKFRNRYNQSISFSYTAKNSRTSSATTNERMTIQPGGEGKAWFLVDDQSSINVFVDKLRFGKDWGSDYAPCDR